jgi:hypothetical protein
MIETVYSSVSEERRLEEELDALRGVFAQVREQLAGLRPENAELKSRTRSWRNGK